MFQYCYAWLILRNRGDVYILMQGQYISPLKHKHTRILILSSCVSTWHVSTQFINIVMNG